MSWELPEGWASVEHWLGRLRENTAIKNLQMFKPWVNWVRVNGSKFADFTPDQMIEYQLNSVGQGRYEILDKIVQPYVMQKAGRHSYKTRLYGTVRSFFLHNRAELPRDPTFKVKATKSKVVGTLNVEDFKKLVYSSNPMYQAIFLCMFQGGMGLEEFNHWNLKGWGATKKQLDDEIRPIKVDLPGRKMARDIRPFYTYIGKDGEKALRNYVENYRPKNGEAVFYSSLKTPLNKHSVYYYWLRHLRKLGIVELPTGRTGHRTGKNPHEMRDLFRTRWQLSEVEQKVGEFLMGHEIDPLGYNKAMQNLNYTRMNYRKAEQWLNVLSEDPEKIPLSELESRVDKLIKEKAPGYQEILKRLEALEMK